jgi:hypothetical protein
MKLQISKSYNFLSSLLVSLVLGAIFFLVVVYKLRSGFFEDVALLVISAFTFMFAVSGFLYTRAQAWPKSSMKRRTLYAAEHCFAGTTFFGLQLLGAGTAFFVAKTLIWFNGGVDHFYGELDYVDIAILFGFFFVNGFRATFDFFYGIRVAIHKSPYLESPASFLRSQKAL